MAIKDQHFTDWSAGDPPATRRRRESLTTEYQCAADWSAGDPPATRRRRGTLIIENFKDQRFTDWNAGDPPATRLRRESLTTEYQCAADWSAGDPPATRRRLGALIIENFKDQHFTDWNARETRLQRASGEGSMTIEYSAPRL